MAHSQIAQQLTPVVQPKTVSHDGVVGPDFSEFEALLDRIKKTGPKMRAGVEDGGIGWQEKTGQLGTIRPAQAHVGVAVYSQALSVDRFGALARCGEKLIEV